MTEERKSSFPVAFAGGIVVVLIVFGAVFLYTETTRAPAPAEQHLSLTDETREYAQRIHFGELQMSRAKNMIGTELTYIAGVVRNEGDRTIKDFEATIEFRDSLEQVVLREIRRPLGKGAAPLGPGARREFQVTIEAVPSSWNQYYPQFRVTGLVLE
jgi:hypothetical protein